MNRWRRSSRRPVTARPLHLACAAIAAAALAAAARHRRRTLPPAGIEVPLPDLHDLPGGYEPASRQPVSATGRSSGDAGPVVR
ncbi:hypothetical protein [Micromonospora endolithica]|uniref:Secreted protein n=1 Tax=Micromonospora endolithica TaxID=230091 RepID=A0A3A9ZCT6_9ACTN|nr:hypothetical protein [Micromonospora endolithica]RKN46143.1 hypothetical protein D7223_14435 [Micromonospora endolithica]TWJ25159.1 hypothetical protein JD76_05322 [Micromonospora endolithica]